MGPCQRHACSACCWDTQMPLTTADIQRLAALGHDPARFSRLGDDRVPYLQTRDATMEDAPHAPPQVADKAEAPRPCVFLVKGACSVYADRPAGCRTYPFVLTTDGKVIRDHDCPWRDEFPRDPALPRTLQRIAFTLHRERDGRLP